MTLIVDGERIEDVIIQREVERLRPDYERVFADKDPRERETQLLDWSRENVIERVLIGQQAKKYRSQIAKAEVEAAFEKIREQCGGPPGLDKEFGTHDEKEIKEEIELRMKAERILQDLCKNLPEPSKQDVLEFYEANKEQFISAERVRVAHIVKHVNGQTDEATAYDTINGAHNELRKGALFEMLVAKYSDCPENGGDLGYITRGQMVEEFEDVAFNLGVGAQSEVFRTRFGFHVAKLYDRKPAFLPALSEVKDQIVTELKNQMRNRTVDEFVDRLKAGAKIEEI